MAWALLSDSERSHWLIPGGANDGDAFPYAVSIFETYTDRLKISWCETAGMEYRLEYRPEAPAHHNYRFRDEVSAARFAAEFGR